MVREKKYRDGNKRTTDSTYRPIYCLISARSMNAPSSILQISGNRVGKIGKFNVPIAPDKFEVVMTKQFFRCLSLSN